MKSKTVFPWKVMVSRDVIGICDDEGYGIANIDTEEHAHMIVRAVNDMYWEDDWTSTEERS